MAKCRTRRARRIDYRSAVRTNIDMSDYVQLEQMLVSKPDCVLQWFEKNGIVCLLDMAMYRRLCVQDPEASERIATSASAHGIPLEREG